MVVALRRNDALFVVDYVELVFENQDAFAGQSLLQTIRATDQGCRWSKQNRRCCAKPNARSRFL